MFEVLWLILNICLYCLGFWGVVSASFNPMPVFWLAIISLGGYMVYNYTKYWKWNKYGGAFKENFPDVDTSKAEDTRIEK